VWHGIKNVMYINGLPDSDQIYCQANFVHEFGKPLKLCRSISYIVGNRYFERLIELNRVQKLIFADKPTFEWFQRQRQYTPYRGICELLQGAFLIGPDFAPTMIQKKQHCLIDSVRLTRWSQIQSQANLIQRNLQTSSCLSWDDTHAVRMR
jgi:hypothetical protein